MKLLNDWVNSASTDVFQAFEGVRWDSYKESEEVRLPIEQRPRFAGFEILLASYVYHDYDGCAFVLARKEGKLYEVNASHCSCYGLEDQWVPEETTSLALRHRMKEGRLGRDYEGTNIFADELTTVLDELNF